MPEEEDELVQIKPPPVGRQHQRRRRQIIADDVLSGKPMWKVCAEHNVSYSTVRNACREHGVSLPRSVGSSKTQRVQAFYILRDILKHPDDTLADVARRNYMSLAAVRSVYRDAKEAGFVLLAEDSDKGETQ